MESESSLDESEAQSIPEAPQCTRVKLRQFIDAVNNFADDFKEHRDLEVVEEMKSIDNGFGRSEYSFEIKEKHQVNPANLWLLHELISAQEEFADCIMYATQRLDLPEIPKELLAKLRKHLKEEMKQKIESVPAKKAQRKKKVSVMEAPAKENPVKEKPVQELPTAMGLKEIKLEDEPAWFPAVRRCAIRSMLQE